MLGTELAFAFSYRIIKCNVEKIGSPMIWVRTLCSKYRSRKFVLLVALILLVVILVLIVVGGRAVALDVCCVVILFLS